MAEGYQQGSTGMTLIHLIIALCLEAGMALPITLTIILWLDCAKPDPREA